MLAYIATFRHPVCPWVCVHSQEWGGVLSLESQSPPWFSRNWERPGCLLLFFLSSAHVLFFHFSCIFVSLIICLICYDFPLLLLVQFESRLSSLHRHIEPRNLQFVCSGLNDCISCLYIYKTHYSADWTSSPAASDQKCCKPQCFGWCECLGNVFHDVLSHIWLVLDHSPNAKKLLRLNAEFTLVPVLYKEIPWDPSIHFLYLLNPLVGSQGGWSLSQRSLGERRGTPWTGRRFVTGPHRDKRDKQPHTHAHS